MKILLYGESLNPGCGSWSYATTLQAMGHEVEHCDSWGGLEHYMSGYGWRLWWRATRRILERHRCAHARRLIRHAEKFKPDVVLVLKGLHIAASDVRAIQATGAWTAIINHDDFFSHNPANISCAQRDALPAWDWVFACREANVDEVRPFNPNVEFFWFGYNPVVHHPVEADASDPEELRRWSSDVAFVGTWESERAAWMEYLVERVDVDFAIWGGQWHKLSKGSPLRQYIRGGEIYLDDQCRAIRCAKISLGFLRKQNRDFFTTRTFEIPACGGLLLGERTDLHKSIYREDVEASFFDVNDPDEMVEKVKQLLADDEGREAIRKAGHAAVLQGGHAYQDRLEQVLAVFERRSIQRGG